MKLLAIVQGDTTDHGGSVINGDQTKRINGFPVAHRGCDVICPLHGTSKIIGEKKQHHTTTKKSFQHGIYWIYIRDHYNFDELHYLGT